MLINRTDTEHDRIRQGATTECAQEVAHGARFAFGQNWARFLASISESRIEEAVTSLRQMLDVDSLRGLRFLDAGCGSGLFSLAACRLGAIVHSFDFDPESVACALELKQRYWPYDTWTIESGSVLDTAYLASLGNFDVVYSWGVLHHTGRMWQALECVAPLVRSGGVLYIAIYNRQRLLSGYWAFVKKTYNRSHPAIRELLNRAYAGFFAVELFLADLVRARSPFARYQRSAGRGMSVYCDVVDWIGGWPFEVASPEEIRRFHAARGFALVKEVTCGKRHGCNEFVFRSEVKTT